MSEKIQLHRRGFLARILQGAAAATVATGTILEVTENKAGATAAKEIDQETGDISFFSPKKWKPWNDLLEKLQTNPEDLSEYEMFQLSQYILRSRNAIKVMYTYSQLQKNMRALVKIHPIVCHTIVHVVTLSDENRKKSQYINWWDSSRENWRDQSTTWDDLLR